LTDNTGIEAGVIQPVSNAPSWLGTPPTSDVVPPVETAAQELPFERLSWEDFEKLCWRLVRLEADVEYCQLYGTRGQSQGGIDIYARRRFDEKYSVYQCKRVTNFRPVDVSRAVNKFLEGTWADRADTFVLCTQESLVPTELAEELETQSQELMKNSVRLLAWDRGELSAKLKELPELVDDFFGRPWVTAFCGQQQADDLENRLTGEEVTSLRTKLASLYALICATQDPGLPAAAQSEYLPLPSQIGTWCLMSTRDAPWNSGSLDRMTLPRAIWLSKTMTLPSAT
jgi:hypothetical protein